MLTLSFINRYENKLRPPSCQIPDICIFRTAVLDCQVLKTLISCVKFFTLQDFQKKRDECFRGSVNFTLFLRTMSND